MYNERNSLKTKFSLAFTDFGIKQRNTLHMDTDDLSREAYHAIIVEAEKLTHDLTLKFGVLSSSCKDESEYLDKSIILAQQILQLEDDELDDLLWGNVPVKDKSDFTLKKIISNIEEVKKIPIKERNYDF